MPAPVRLVCRAAASRPRESGGASGAAGGRGNARSVRACTETEAKAWPGQGRRRFAAWTRGHEIYPWPA